MKAAMNPSSMKSAAANRSSAKTAMTEILGTLSTIAPGTEILLALKTLRAADAVLIQLAQIRRGRCCPLTAQVTLRTRLQPAA
jgi:hypothetical protein